MILSGTDSVAQLLKGVRLLLSGASSTLAVSALDEAQYAEVLSIMTNTHHVKRFVLLNMRPGTVLLAAQLMQKLTGLRTVEIHLRANFIVEPLLQALPQMRGVELQLRDTLQQRHIDAIASVLSHPEYHITVLNLPFGTVPVNVDVPGMREILLKRSLTKLHLRLTETAAAGDLLRHLKGRDAELQLDVTAKYARASKWEQLQKQLRQGYPVRSLTMDAYMNTSRALKEMVPRLIDLEELTLCNSGAGIVTFLPEALSACRALRRLHMPNSSPENAKALLDCLRDGMMPRLEHLACSVWSSKHMRALEGLIQERPLTGVHIYLMSRQLVSLPFLQRLAKSKTLHHFWIYGVKLNAVQRSAYYKVLRAVFKNAAWSRRCAAVQAGAHKQVVALL